MGPKPNWTTTHRGSTSAGRGLDLTSLFHRPSPAFLQVTTCGGEAWPASAIEGSGSRWFFGPTWGFSTDLRMFARADTHIGQSDADHGRANPPQKVSGSSCLVKSCCEALPHDQNDIDEGCQRLGVVETQKRRCLDENHLRQVSGCFQYRRRAQCQLPAVRDEWNQWDRRDVGQRRRPQGASRTSGAIGAIGSWPGGLTRLLA